MSPLSFQNDGLEIVKALLDRDEIEEIKADIDLENEKLRKYGIRNLEKRFDSIGRLVDHARLRKLADELLGSDSRRLPNALSVGSQSIAQWAQEMQ